jgi:AcrR family transcriptional regulator
MLDSCPAMTKTDRREQLLRAARDVFATKGYHQAKVDDITAAAGVGKGTFYLYFKDKRSVLEELVDGVFERIGSAILKVDPAADIEEQIKHNVRAIIAVLLDDPALPRLLLSYAAGLDPAFLEKLESFYGGVKAMLEESLRDGQKLGIVAEGDPRLYASFTIGALKEILLEYPGHARSREQIVGELYALLQRGYLRTAADSRVSALDEGGRPAGRRKMNKT